MQVLLKKEHMPNSESVILASFFFGNHFIIKGS